MCCVFISRINYTHTHTHLHMCWQIFLYPTQTFLNSSTCPEIHGHLHAKEISRKSWKKFYFVLRRSGLYFSSKGMSKVSKTKSSTGCCSLCIVGKSKAIIIQWEFFFFTRLKPFCCSQYFLLFFMKNENAQHHLQKRNAWLNLWTNPINVPLHSGFIYFSLVLWKGRETGWAWFSLGQLAQQPGRNSALNAADKWTSYRGTGRANANFSTAFISYNSGPFVCRAQEGFGTVPAFCSSRFTFICGLGRTHCKLVRTVAPSCGFTLNKEVGTVCHMKRRTVEVLVLFFSPRKFISGTMWLFILRTAQINISKFILISLITFIVQPHPESLIIDSLNNMHCYECNLNSCSVLHQLKRSDCNSGFNSTPKGIYPRFAVKVLYENNFLLNYKIKLEWHWVHCKPPPRSNSPLMKWIN